MSQNSNDEIVVDLINWLNFLDVLHDNYPTVYNDPDSALIGFEEDWQAYLAILNKYKEK